MPWQNCGNKVYLVIILFCMPWQNCGNKVIILFCMPWQNCGNKVNLVCVCACTHTCMCMCVHVCVFLSLQHFDMIKGKTYGLFKTYFYIYRYKYISYRQSVNSKTIKSVTTLSQSGFWLKSVQSEISECSTLPRHVSH